jgi:dTMP kinase
MTNRSGTFIVVEGIDGMGKSTQIARLAAYLEQRGHFVRRSREPTDSEYGCEIRRIAREGRDGVSLEQELDLFLKDREIDVRDNILPALEAGGIALVDRYFYSNIAYQGALGLDPERIRAANSPRFPTPDLMLLFDAPPQVGIERIRQGRGEANNQGYEQEAFLEQVRANFLAMPDPEIIRIDAARDEEAVAAQVQNAVDRVINKSLSQ